MSCPVARPPRSCSAAFPDEPFGPRLTSGSILALHDAPAWRLHVTDYEHEHRAVGQRKAAWRSEFLRLGRRRSTHDRDPAAHPAARPTRIPLLRPALLEDSYRSRHAAKRAVGQLADGAVVIQKMIVRADISVERRLQLIDDINLTIPERGVSVASLRRRFPRSGRHRCHPARLLARGSLKPCSWSSRPTRSERDYAFGSDTVLGLRMPRLGTTLADGPSLDGGRRRSPHRT